MKLPVMLELPPDDSLVAGSHTEIVGGRATLSVDALIPEKLAVDRSYSPIPNAPDVATTAFGDVMPFNYPKSYVVRGTIDVDAPDDIPVELEGRRILADPEVDTYSFCLTDSPIGTAADVSDNLRLDALHAAGFDGDEVAIAIVDGGINLDFLEAKLGFRPKIDEQFSWQPPDIDLPPGGYPVGHGTMCAYAALLAAPKATLIDMPALVGTPIGGSRFGKRLSIVNMAISQLASFWSIAFTASGTRKYKGLVISNSYGLYHPSWDFPAGHPGRYSDNPNHTFTWNVSGLARNGRADLVFAAGNCGSGCPDAKCQDMTTEAITGANASDNVLTIGGCSIDGDPAGYSSSGPGISGMSQEKPDLLAFTHFLGSEALGSGQPDKGTSTACPIAAGCIAALRSKISADEVPPATLKQTLLDTAKSDGASIWDPARGFGLVDPTAAAATLGFTLGS